MAVCLLTGMTLTASPVNSEPLTSGSWSDEFTAPGFDGTVRELVESDGNLIALGDFESVDGVPAAGLAIWDGRVWAAHPGANGFDSETHRSELAVSPDGVLYLTIDAGLTKWTGSDWELLPGSVDMRGVVFDSSGTLFAVETIRSGGEPQSLIYRDRAHTFTGESWEPLGETLQSPGGWDRHTFEIDMGPDDELLLATDTGVERWDGNAWVDRLGGGFPEDLESIAQLKVAPDGKVVVTGWSAVGEFRFLTMYWDGVAWEAFESESYVAWLVADSNNVFHALSDGVVIRLTGQGWEPLGAVGAPYEPRDLINYQDSLVVTTARVLTDMGEWLGGVAQLSPENIWVGLNESTGGKGLAGWIKAGTATADGKLVVGGSMLTTFDGQTGSVMTWDGDSWSVSSTEGLVTELTTTSDGKILSFGSEGILLQTGDSWTEVGPAVEVQSMEPDNAGGLVVLTADQRVIRWDGDSTWTAVPQPPGIPVKVVELDDGSLVSGGYLSEPPLVRLVDGVWQSLGLTNGIVTEIAVSPDGDLYVLGNFYLPDGTYVDGIATWDGSAWKALRRNPRGVVAFDGCGVPLIGRSNGAAITRWDGSDWQTLGSLDSTVGVRMPEFVVSIGPDIYSGGNIRSVEGQESVGIVRWTSPSHGFREDASSIGDIIESCDYDLASHPEVLRLYRAFFAREPDVGGAQYWLDVFDNGASLGEITEWFTQSQEFAYDYEGTTDEAYLEAVYLNVLGREYDQGGFDYWLDLLSSGQLTRGEVVRWIAANNEFALKYPYGQ